MLYWIVQPLWAHGRSNSGFRTFFMPAPGMARVEYQAPGHDLRKLYEAAGGVPVIEKYQIAVASTSRPVYFVGPEKDLASRAREMPLWLGSGGKTKRPCGFAEIFHTSTDELRDDGDPPTVAWWVMDQNFMFTLDPTVAENLITAILLEAETHAAFGDDGWA
jgi:hypothetical protein